MVRQTTKVILLEILGVISLLIMAAIAILAIMLASGPVELGMFRDDVEQSLTDARGGRAVSMERLTLQWSPSERRLFVVANELSLKDDQGEEAARVGAAHMTLDAGDLFLRKFTVLGVDISDGWIDVHSTGPNLWSVAGEPLPPIQAGVLPTTPAGWIELTERVLSDTRGALDASHDLFELETLEFSDLEIRVRGPQGELYGIVTEAMGRGEKGVADMSIAMEGAGGGLGLPGRVAASLSTSDNYGALRADITVDDLPFADLASRFGLDMMDTGDLKLDVTFAAGMTEQGGLEQIGFAMEHQAGSLDLPTIGDVLRDITMGVTYRPEQDAITVDQLVMRSDLIETTLTGRLQSVLEENILRRVELSAESLALKQTPISPLGWNISNLEFGADVSDDFSLMVFDKFTARVGEGVFNASGELDLSPKAEEGQVPISLDLTAELVGELTKDEVLAFWPERLGDGARRFVVARVEDVRLTEASVSLALRPDSLEQGHLRDGDLGVSFGFKDGRVRFLDDVPPVENAVGSGRLSGNSFGLSVLAATYGDWEVERGQVEFPAFMPRGEPFTVTAQGRGPAVSIMRYISDSRLQLEAETGFDPDRISGEGEAVFFMSRPALSNVPFEDLQLEATGTIRNAGLSQVVMGLDLSEATVDVDYKNTRLVLTGHGEIGPAPVQFTWRDEFGQDERSADISASAIVTPDVLNELGLVGRAYLTGEIPIEMQGKVSADGLGDAAFGLDFRDARIDIEEIGWIKPAGEPARASLSYSGDGVAQASALRVEGQGLSMTGDVLLGQGGRLESLTLSKLFVEGSADVSGTVRRTPEGDMAINFVGDYFDISSLLSSISGIGTGMGGGAVDDPVLPVLLNAEVGRLRLQRGLDLTDATLAIDARGGKLQSADASGTMRGGKTLLATYEDKIPGAAPRISLTTGDAGFIAEAFFGMGFIRGGAMTLTGTLAANGQPAKLNASVRDARLSDAPVVTQILSLASLRGLADTLSGDGVLFSRIEVPVSIGGGRYVIDGGRASGPALGLTVNGWIGTDGRGIELDGVLVPSFGVNSVLGGVPIIGDLFVGRQGEGIFSITYSVRGTLEKAQVAVNPLSAVTPGILRRIFENPSDTSIPDAIPVDPSLRPPTAKLPSLPEDEVIGETPGAG
ncbi:MAG: AsmA-like C-terminal region-containing protein [Pseudomonadota bacterium]